MSTSTLIRSKGATIVTPEELVEFKTPQPQGRWYPLSHATVLRRVTDTLGESGLTVAKQQLAVSRDGARFFGTLDLVSELAVGVRLSVGVRNSVDKSFPIGFCAGSRVLVCENLAFSAELLVRRKHTRHGEQRFAADIAAAMPKLGQFRELEAKRIEGMARTEVTDTLAESIILRAFEKGVVPAPLLPAVIREWREPKFDDFKPRTLWSLFNAFTSALTPKAKANPQSYSLTTMRLNALVAPALPEPLAIAA
jgi:hypothetical protein